MHAPRDYDAITKATVTEKHSKCTTAGAGQGSAQHSSLHVQTFNAVGGAVPRKEYHWQLQ
jgi:hypothetical protein